MLPAQEETLFAISQLHARWLMPILVCADAWQVTAFVALLALDAQRIKERRLDVAPCIQLPAEYLGAAADGHTGNDSAAEEPLLSADASEEIPVSTIGGTRTTEGNDHFHASVCCSGRICARFLSTTGQQCGEA